MTPPAKPNEPPSAAADGVLSYGRQQPRRWTRALMAFFVTLAVFSGLYLLASGIAVRTSNLWICGICGTHHTRIDWTFGFSTKDGYRFTALQQWMDPHGLPHEHDWHHVKGTGESLTGRTLSHAHGSAPANYALSTANDDLVRLLSEDELRRFLQIMMSGTDAEKETAVVDAWVRLFARQ